MTTGLELYWRVQRALEACVRSPTEDLFVLCSETIDPMIHLFSSLCPHPTEFIVAQSASHVCLHVCVFVSYSQCSGRFKGW